MPVVKYENTAPEKISEDIERKMIYTKSLMTAIIDLSNGPQDKPDKPHSHPHEQTSYVAEGEIYLFIEGDERHHLKAGDMYAIPSGVPHGIQRLTEKVRIIDNFTPLREDFIIS